MSNKENGQLSFLDIISILSFCISIMNYDENMTQSDKQELLGGLTKQTKVLLDEIHGHLEEQDKKIEKILEEISK